MQRIFCAIISLLLVTNCASVQSAPPQQVPERFIPAKHIVFIGLDGWGGVYTAKADMPTVKRMMDGGASTLDMRSIKPNVSWPNWTTLFYGTPPEHRNSNDFPLDDFPSIFTIVKNNIKKNNIVKNNANTSVLFYEWPAMYNICHDQEAEKIIIASDIQSAQNIGAYIIKNKPTFTAIAFKGPDSTGHKKRWGSRAYYSILAQIDECIAVIEQSVKDAGIYDNTVFVLSADHGGLFWWGHGFMNITRERKIPFIVYGKGIQKGSVIPSPAHIYDIAPVIAAALGLEQPEQWSGNLLPGIFE